MSIDIRKLLEVIGGIILIIGAIAGFMHYQDDKHASKPEHEMTKQELENSKTDIQVKLLERDVREKSGDAEKYRVQNLYWCERARKNTDDEHAAGVCDYLEKEQQELMQEVQEDRTLLKQIKAGQ